MNDWPACGLARAARHELLEDGRRGAVAERDHGPRQQGAIGGAGAPADDDRPVEPDAGRDVEDDALRSRAPGSAGRTGRRPGASRRRRGARGRGPGRARRGRRCSSARRRRRSPRATGRPRRGRPRRSRGGRRCRPAGQPRPARSAARGRASRSRARRRAGRCTSCTAGSTRPGAPRRARTPPVRSAGEPVLRAGDRADRVDVSPRRPGGRSR